MSYFYYGRSMTTHHDHINRKKKTEKEDALPYQIIIYIKPMLNIIGQDFLLISLNKYTFF